MCVDFRELNKVSKSFYFPLPLIEDILDRYFSTLDLSQGFHQVLVQEEDREKTAFSSDIGHYHYKPFVLKTLPGFFQSLLNNILSGLIGEKCFVYLDDVIIFSSTIDKHEDRIKKCFSKVQRKQLKIKPAKMFIFT